MSLSPSKTIRTLCLCPVLVAHSSAHAQIFDWTSTNVQYLHGSGYLFGAPDREIITIEHANGWAYGHNFLFVDTIYHHEQNQDPTSWEAYGEFYTFLSASKLTQMSIPIPGIKDLDIVLGFNAGSQPERQPYRAYLAGASIQFDFPQFHYAELAFMAYQNEFLPTTAVQITPTWQLPFEVFDLHFQFRGFMDYVTAGGAGPASTVLFQPQLLLDLGATFGAHNHLLAGVEYQYWHNKFGLNGFDEQLPQSVVMLRF